MSLADEAVKDLGLQDHVCRLSLHMRCLARLKASCALQHTHTYTHTQPTYSQFSLFLSVAVFAFPLYAPPSGKGTGG